MKIAIHQFDPIVGNPRINFSRIVGCVNDTCADMHLFGELSLVGYYSQDIFLNKQIQEQVDGCIKDIENVKHNYSYFPIFINKKEFGISRDELYYKLKENNIFGRRYFYPLITDFLPYKNLFNKSSVNFPNAKKISEEVICLPLYPELSKSEIDYIFNVINS